MNRDACIKIGGPLPASTGNAICGRERTSQRRPRCGTRRAWYFSRPNPIGVAMLYLASQSPRRRQLLEQLGVRPEIIDVDVPEVRAPGEAPLDYVSRVAREKAGAGL